MRSFVSILLLFALCLVAAALVAYPFWLVVGFIDDQPIHRVLHRIAMLCALIGLVWLFRRWRAIDRQSCGFGPPQSGFWRQLTAGIIVGAVAILPLLITLQVFDVRITDEGVQMTGWLAVATIAKGLATGLIVGLIEELFFRGLLLTVIERESGRTLAVILPSVLYASAHFLGGRLHVPADQIHWSSGFDVLGRMFIAYSQPAVIVDSFLSLFAVGVLLALVRLHTGTIAACIGLHAAWVCVLYYYEAITNLNPDGTAQWLVGSYDGIIGWGSVAWMGVIALIYATTARRAQSLAAVATE